MNDALGDRMKHYEEVTRAHLLPHSLTILRVDGRAFHTYLRKAAKPFDLDFVDAMKHVGQGLCTAIPGTVIAYGQSDEVSLLISDKDLRTDAWFGGSIQKMTSVAASIATAELIYQRGASGMPTFDARVFTLPTWTEAKNYFVWRQRDAVRNSIMMAGLAMFSHTQLHGKNTNEIQEMLFQEHGINWNDYPEDVKRGWVLRREVREATVTYTDKRTSEVREIDAMRSSWEPSNPHFTVDYKFPAANPAPQKESV